nr:Chain C, TYR-LEU-GLN-LEU-ARG-THR-PHE-LEU-LEU [Severe acute respiratory syndrome-related coronavirus]7P3E_F Chain F, TYR-LEU-GLN-LEU-ARG-THR-PHE-LEU-LEU [Severe acute respiratory syndrome-related coronavirus]
YLQLRTFLL